jgi:hypothetical protein
MVGFQQAPCSAVSATEFHYAAVHLSKHRRTIHENKENDDASQTLRPLLPTVQSRVRKGATIQERFQALHKANPHVYRALR